MPKGVEVRLLSRAHLENLNEQSEFRFSYAPQKVGQWKLWYNKTAKEPGKRLFSLDGSYSERNMGGSKESIAGREFYVF